MPEGVRFGLGCMYPGLCRFSVILPGDNAKAICRVGKGLAQADTAPTQPRVCEGELYETRTMRAQSLVKHVKAAQCAGAGRQRCGSWC